MDLDKLATEVNAATLKHGLAAQYGFVLRNAQPNQPFSSELALPVEEVVKALSRTIPQGRKRLEQIASLKKRLQGINVELDLPIKEGQHVHWSLEERDDELAGYLVIRHQGRVYDVVKFEVKSDVQQWAGYMLVDGKLHPTLSPYRSTD